MVMTMNKPVRHMPAGAFKAKCLSVLDDVASSRREIVITKRGLPVARLVPLEAGSQAPLQGLILLQEDLVSPLDVEWDAAK
jgi:prevent-host-death family protein